MKLLLINPCTLYVAVRAVLDSYFDGKPYFGSVQRYREENARLRDEVEELHKQVRDLSSGAASNVDYIRRYGKGG